MMKKNLLISKSIGVFPDNYNLNVRQYALTWLSRVCRWRQNVKTRKHLEELPTYLLRDVNLSERQMRCEIKKKFWQ